MKFYGYVTTRLYSSKPSERSRVRSLLSEILCLDRKVIDSVLFFYGKELKQIPSERIIQNCKLCKNLNVELNPITNIPNVLRQNSIFLKHKIFLLQEMGVPNISLSLITRISKDMNTSANDFKKKTNIPKDQHIMTNLTKHIVEQTSNVPPLALLDETLPVIMHYEQCILYYTTVKLGLSDKSLCKQGKRYKSIRIMLKMLQLCKENLGLDEDYIRKQPSILVLCPDNAKAVIQSLRYIGIDTIRLQDIIRKQPEILSYNPQNITKILQSFKKYELPVTAVNSCVRVLKVNHNTFERRMEYLLSLPMIQVWSNDSHILHCIINDKKVKQRIKYLEQAGLSKWANIKTLICDEKQFAKNCQEEFLHTKKYKYIKYILCNELGSDKHHLIDFLRRHPYWNRIAYNDIYNTLCYLKENFSNEDICNNIQLILYQWPLIDKWLQEVEKFNYYDRNNILTPTQRLALCLYYLEKNNHFTGDGVWGPYKIEEKQRKELSQNGVLSEIDNNLNYLNNNQFCMISQHTRFSDAES